jgi:hypothetical protein
MGDGTYLCERGTMKKSGGSFEDLILTWRRRAVLWLRVGDRISLSFVRNYMLENIITWHKNTY